MKKSSPVYSFPKAKINPKSLDSHMSQLALDYSVNRSKAPSYLFGKTQKLATTKHDTPGPGHYRSKHFSPKNSHVFDKSKRQNSKKNKSPGPFQYNPDRQGVGPKSPSYSMRLKSKQRYEIISPGPGHYNVESSNNSTSFKITQTKKQTTLDRKQDLPGPGAYNISQEQNTKGFSFGNAKRLRTHSQLTPGPGNYDIQLSSDLHKSITIAQKILTTQENDNPGPGSYEIRIPSSVRFAISNSKRLLKIQNQVPGPGSYLIKQDWNQSTFLTPKALRNPLNVNQNPGPSHYKPVFQNKSLSAPIGRKIQVLTVPKTPGPGSYIRNLNSLSKISASLGKSKRFMKQRSEMPGPGSYPSPAQPKTGISFPKQKRLKRMHNQNSPGPADYRIPPSILNVPSYIKF